MTLEDYHRHVARRRQQRPLFILDLAVPRDFDPAIGDELGVYLYGIDDLTEACERNRAERSKELPAAEAIVDEETRRFVAEVRHRATGPVIARFREGLESIAVGRIGAALSAAARTSTSARAARSDNSPIAWWARCSTRPWPRSATNRKAARPMACLEALQRLFQLKD